MDVDGAVSEAVYVGDDRAPALNWLLEALTTPGGAAFRLVVFLAVLAWLVRRRQWPVAVWVLTAVVFIGPLTSLLKDVVRADPSRLRRGRRAAGVPELPQRAFVRDRHPRDRGARSWPGRSSRPAPGGCGCPWASLVVVLVGLTRMLLGVHFLSDVVGGWALGVAWSLGVALVFGAMPGGRGALPAGRRDRSVDEESR